MGANELKESESPEVRMAHANARMMVMAIAQKLLWILFFPAYV